MSVLTIRDMTSTDEAFVGTCSHIGDEGELTACSRRRLRWLADKTSQGLRVKVSLLNGQRAGLLYVMPIEICPWGPLGRDLLTIPCLFIKPDAQSHGVGRALVNEAELEVERQGKKGLVTVAYYENSWFMPAPFFERLGFTSINRRGRAGMLWKARDLTAEPPQFLQPAYEHKPLLGRVIVDLFWHTFCGTSNIEAQRVREVAADFGERVVVREYCADDRAVFNDHQRPRGVFVNGEEIGWGYAAPRNKIREAIQRALST
ncbi:MAG: GNAT family N-acetyltransferase [candidate division Zixibacteria bacterium]|jgi:GNAT superfamily N-acetyltransferase|nr:GNAT family N-acetyltransferase [candidate division Zixibacteria bacterium]